MNVRMPKRAPDAALFPSFVARHSVEFDLSDARELELQFPNVGAIPSIAGAVRKRQMEVLAGRYCARQALLELAPHEANTPIGVGPHREPLWPPGIVGSITHTHGYASVALASVRYARALGLDAESWMDADAAASLQPQIAAAPEVEAMADALHLPLARALTLAFSAKETIFKCLFPEVKRYFQFRDVWMSMTNEGQLEGRLLVPLTPALLAGRRFAIRYICDEHLVHTGAILAD